MPAKKKISRAAPKPRAKRVMKALSQRVKVYQEPTNAKDQIFAERYAVHLDHNRAYIESGYQYDVANALRKLHSLKPYIDKLRAKIENKLIGSLSYQRKDILEGIAAIGMANPLDYYHEFEVMDPKTQQVMKGMALKPLKMLTRLQASAIEDMTYHLESGRISYKLPSLATKLNALNTLGENTGATKKKEDGRTSNHVHFHDVPIEKLRDLMQGFSTLLGPQASRAVLGLTEETPDD